MQQLNEKLQDRDEKIDEQNSKIEILTGESKQIKESYDKLLAKLTNIQDNHIIIPKESNYYGTDDRLISTSDEQYLNNLQDEVRKLHFQLKQKDSIIDKLKQTVQESEPTTD